jgi:hypothetical protein
MKRLLVRGLVVLAASPGAGVTPNVVHTADIAAILVC